MECEGDTAEQVALAVPRPGGRGALEVEEEDEAREEDMGSQDVAYGRTRTPSPEHGALASPPVTPFEHPRATPAYAAVLRRHGTAPTTPPPPTVLHGAAPQMGRALPTPQPRHGYPHKQWAFLTTMEGVQEAAECGARQPQSRWYIVPTPLDGTCMFWTFRLGVEVWRAMSTLAAYPPSAEPLMLDATDARPCLKLDKRGAASTIVPNEHLHAGAQLLRLQTVNALAGCANEVSPLSGLSLRDEVLLSMGVSLDDATQAAERDVRWTRYLGELAKPSGWGGHRELAVLARVLRVSVEVYDYEGEDADGTDDGRIVLHHTIPQRTDADADHMTLAVSRVPHPPPHHDAMHTTTLRVLFSRRLNHYMLLLTAAEYSALFTRYGFAGTHVVMAAWEAGTPRFLNDPRLRAQYPSKMAALERMLLHPDGEAAETEAAVAEGAVNATTALGSGAGAADGTVAAEDQV